MRLRTVIFFVAAVFSVGAFAASTTGGPAVLGFQLTKTSVLPPVVYINVRMNNQFLYPYPAPIKTDALPITSTLDNKGIQDDIDHGSMHAGNNTVQFYACPNGKACTIALKQTTYQFLITKVSPGVYTATPNLVSITLQ